MKGIFLLELDDDEEPADDGDHVKISLHAFTSIRMGRTVRWKMLVNGHELFALVDSGSTHTFLAEAVAHRLCMMPRPRPGMGVTMANGDRVTSSSVCTNTHFIIGHEEFFVDYYVIPLEWFDVILGVKWLCTLVPILWDFMKLTMSFWRDDHCVTWSGLDTAVTEAQVCTMTGQDLMGELLTKF